MRGQTADFKTTGAYEVLNFSGHTPGYAYRLVELQLYPVGTIGDANFEMSVAITAGKTAIDPQAPNFNDEGLIAVSMFSAFDGNPRYVDDLSVINDLFPITQDLILSVTETTASLASNWQCKFEKVKLSGAAEAAANFKQFTISDG